MHSVTRAPHANLYLVCDKGNDEIVFFSIDEESRTLRRLPGTLKSPHGSSPRYAAFHPTRPFVFVNHETQAIVSAIAYGQTGARSLICTASALPPDISDSMAMKQSDIAVHPNGKRLYSMIRGISAISIFDIDPNSGALERIDTVALDVEGPRGCAISADGRFMVIAAWDSKEVTVWKISEAGGLTPTSHKAKTPNAGTVTFFYPPSSLAAT